MLDYTKKTGETEVIKKIFAFLQSQEGIRQNIMEKQNNKKSFAIGDDNTLDNDRAEAERRLKQVAGDNPGVV